MTIAGVAVVPAGAEEGSDPGPLRVLIVGDSVTSGSAGDFTWRYRLWKHLVAGGSSVDFVGPNDGVWDNVAGGLSPAYADPDFDQDHGARWGMTLASQDHPIADLMATYQPDVVIEMLGVNDLTFLQREPTAVAGDVASFVDDVRSVDPDTDVVLVRQVQSWYPKVPELNTLLDDLATSSDEVTSRVTVARADEGFELQTDTWDSAHPNAQGELLIAAAVADALAAIGLGNPYPRPLPTLPLGPREGAVLTGAARDGGAALSWTGPPGATEEFIWLRNMSRGGRWQRLPLPVPGTGFHLDALINGDSYQVRLQPVKGYWAAQGGVRSNTIVVRPLPPRPGRVVLKRVWSPRRDRVRVIARSVSGATSYRLELAPTTSCAITPARFTRKVAGLTKPRTTYPTKAPFVRVRTRAHNVAGFGPVSAVSRCVRVR